MNNRNIVTTTAELEMRKANMYKTLAEEGTFLLHLDFRAWNKQRTMGLICYFTTEDGEKVRLHIWRQGEVYRPKKCDMDFTQVDDGTWWKCTLKKNRKGYPEWIEAEKV